MHDTVHTSGKSYMTQPGYATLNKMGDTFEMSTEGLGATRWEKIYVTKMRVLCHESSFNEQPEKCIT